MRSDKERIKEKSSDVFAPQMIVFICITVYFVLLFCQTKIKSSKQIYINSYLAMFLSCFRETLRDVLQMLENTVNPQVEHIIRTMKTWAKENRVAVI